MNSHTIQINFFKPPLHACIACNSDKLVFFDERTSRDETLRNIKFRLSRCEECGLVFINPRPTKDLLASIYKKSGHGLNKPIELDKVLGQEKEYPNATVDSKRIINNINIFLEYSQNPKASKPYELLDIGSGYGFYSHEAISQGFNVTAINPSIWENNIFEKLNGFRPIQSFFEDYDFNKKFDVVILSQILEHIDDPKLFLGKIRNVLNDSGIIAIAVPNIHSYLIKLGSRSGGVFWIPEHLNCFSRKSLDCLFSDTGFEILKCHGVSRFPYFFISNYYDLTGVLRRISNFFVKYIQYFPLKMFDVIGWGGVLNYYIKIKQ